MSNALELDSNQELEVKELYAKLVNLYEEKANLEAIKKDRENTLKDDIAAVCDIKDKEGIPQGSKVKMPLVQAILNQLYREQPNKKDEEFDLLETYRDAIKKEEVSKELIDAYIATEDLIQENKENIKEAFKETSLLSKEILSAVDMIVKEKYKAMKEYALEKQGFEVPVPKDKSDIEFIKQNLESFLDGGK